MTGRSHQRGRPSIAGMGVALVVTVVFAALLVVNHVGGGSSVHSSTVSTNPSNFVLPSLEGHGDVRLTSFKGKPAVVTFFASWCSACQGELPGFAVVSRALTGRVTFIGVNSFETGNGMAMARQYGIAWWPIARDVGGAEASGSTMHWAASGCRSRLSTAREESFSRSRPVHSTSRRCRCGCSSTLASQTLAEP